MGSLPGPWSAEPGVEHTTFPEPRQGGPERSATPALALLPTPPCVAVECTLLAMTSIKPAFQRAVWLCRQTWPAASAPVSPAQGPWRPHWEVAPCCPALPGWEASLRQELAAPGVGAGDSLLGPCWDAGLCGICCSLCPSALLRATGEREGAFPSAGGGGGCPAGPGIAAGPEPEQLNFCPCPHPRGVDGRPSAGRKGFVWLERRGSSLCSLSVLSRI